MVTTQDVSFGMYWVKLVGPLARWSAGDDDAPPLHVGEGESRARVFGPGLVAIWVYDQAPVLICEPTKGMRAIRALAPGAAIDDIRRTLREAGAVVREVDEARRDPSA